MKFQVLLQAKLSTNDLELQHILHPNDDDGQPGLESFSQLKKGLKRGKENWFRLNAAMPETNCNLLAES